MQAGKIETDFKSLERDGICRLGGHMAIKRVGIIIKTLPGVRG